MTIKVFKDSFDNCYFVNIYKQCEAYFYFDFYPVLECDGVYLLARIFDEVKVETFKEYTLKKFLDADFSFFFRINLEDQRFFSDELLWEETTAETLKQASKFCRNYWLENYATNLPK